METENKNFHIPQITLDIKLQKNIIICNKYHKKKPSHSCGTAPFMVKQNTIISLPAVLKNYRHSFSLFLSCVLHAVRSHDGV